VIPYRPFTLSFNPFPPERQARKPWPVEKEPPRWQRTPRGPNLNQIEPRRDSSIREKNSREPCQKSMGSPGIWKRTVALKISNSDGWGKRKSSYPLPLADPGHAPASGIRNAFPGRVRYPPRRLRRGDRQKKRD
jgi:hypothetical protein